MKKYFKSSSEKGSAMVWILTAVVLFAALSFLMTDSSRTSTSSITNTKNTAYTNDIIAYSSDIKSAIKRLKLRGCKDTEISFENPIVTGYINVNAPANKKCHVFETAGGGINWSTPPNIDILAETTYVFSARSSILGMGSDCADSSCSELYLILRSLSKEICMKYNNIAGIQNNTNDAPVENGLNFSTKFTGTYVAVSGVLGDDNDGARFSKKPFGCYKDATESYLGQPYYDFYYTLIAR